MEIPDGAYVAVIDGEKFVWLRNTGDAANPQLENLGSPDLDPAARSAGMMRDSGATQHHTDPDLDEAAHSAAVAEWLNHQAKTNKFEHVIVVADKRSLGELRPHYHMELEKRLVGEVGKAVANQPTGDIMQAITTA